MSVSRNTTLSLNRPPRIGITPEERNDRGDLILPTTYLDAIARAGGLPLILSPWHNSAQEVLPMLDGLILSGGGDLDPRLYAGEVHASIYGIDPRRDAFDIDLVRLAVQNELPTLAICRGFQVANVALGGDLHPHLPDILGTRVEHRGDPPSYVPHAVHVLPGTRLREHLACERVDPESWHHQAVRRLATDLTINALADDGCIEGAELSDYAYFLAVQWHPETTAATDSTQQRLFDGLVAAAARRAGHIRFPVRGAELEQ
jgi:putative glutamine amidotransferase